MRRIDLHTHSTASDGTASPRELVRLAKDAGLAAIALTDHDTVGGLPEALAAGEEYGIEVIPGCELSCESDVGWMHIVGLWAPVEPKALAGAFEYVINGREVRNRLIVEKLNELGVDVTYEELRAMAEGVLGRPHFARALMDHGVVRTVQQAFDEYLGEDGKAYVPKAKLTPEKAIAALKADGALAVLAHPFMLRLDAAGMREKVGELKDYGLDGIEVFYTEHSAEQTDAFARLAGDLGLLMSGGSDFHGTVKPNTRLGEGKGDLAIPYSLLEEMKDYRRERGLWV